MARESITRDGYRRAATHYGRRLNEDKYPAVYQPEQGKECLEVTFAYDDLPSYSLDKLVQSIPAKAVILSASLHVETAFAGGTSLAIGLHQSDGTAIDADGLFTDAELPLANIDAAGDYIAAAGGALVGTSIGAAAGQLVVAATGTFTAGEATLKVTYQPLLERLDQFNDD